MGVEMITAAGRIKRSSELVPASGRKGGRVISSCWIRPPAAPVGVSAHQQTLGVKDPRRKMKMFKQKVAIPRVFEAYVSEG